MACDDNKHVVIDWLKDCSVLNKQLVALLLPLRTAFWMSSCAQNKSVLLWLHILIKLNPSIVYLTLKHVALSATKFCAYQILNHKSFEST